MVDETLFPFFVEVALLSPPLPPPLEDVPPSEDFEEADSEEEDSFEEDSEEEDSEEPPFPFGAGSVFFRA